MKVIREPTHMSGFLYESPAAEAPSLLHCGEAFCASGHSVKPHSHAGFEFHYLSRGKLYGWKVSEECFEQRVGEVFVTYPGEKHASARKRYPECYFLWIGLDLDGLGSIGKRVAKLLRAQHCRLLPDCHEVEPLLRGLISQILVNRTDRKAAIRCYLDAITVVLSQRIPSRRAQRMDAKVMLPYSHGTMKAVSYLEKNLHRRVSLTELAAVAARRDVTNLCAQFRREVGAPPSAFHRRLRLQAAREALRQSSFDITTAAMQFGFYSSQHFSSCFRREFGTTPAQFRASGRGRN